jgi:16S rRNA (adenine1518-N6/adenine1519-N6)-dimethyltransferase
LGLLTAVMRPKKRYGQHFLQPEWAHKLIEAIGPNPDDRFLEIGPGPGALTLRLAPLVSHVTAIEVDPDMVAALRPRLPENVDLVEADILETDLGALATAQMRVAGNLPYNVSSPILFRLLAARRAGAVFTDATLMLQREVADRIVSGPGTKDYGVLSILVQLHADVRIVLTLPPGAFRPAPKVHSAVVRLTFRPPAVQLTDEALFEAMVRSMFTQRRKTLSNALKPFAEAQGAVAAEALRGSDIDPRRRPETLQLDELARLAEYFAARTR